MALFEKIPPFEQLTLFRKTAAPTPTPTQPQRVILLGNQVLSYTLKQDRRRRMSMRIDERGLRIGAPQSVNLREIESFITNNSEWVLRKLSEFSNRQVRRNLPIHHGACLPVLGREVVIHIAAGANRICWQDDRLLLAARADADHAALARRALQQRALELFTERMHCYAAQLALTPPRLGLSSARTRWGSCSARSGIRLNWRLIHLPLPLIDYVVVHELAHLREMNHSPRFWAVVESVYPDWRSARGALKAQGGSVPLL